MQNPPRFDFGPGGNPPSSTPPGGSGGTPPYFPPPPYREELPALNQDGTPRSGLAKILPTLVTLSAFGGLALLGWFAYQEGRAPVMEGEIPVIKADNEEFKHEPENPGGEEIPHMDKEVYNSYSSGGAAQQAAAPTPQENPAEQPVDRNFLKQFAGTGAEEDSAEPGEKQETVEFGQVPAAPAAPAEPVATGAELAAPSPAAQPVVPVYQPKPLIPEPATPNTGGVVALQDLEQETAPPAPEPEAVKAAPAVKEVQKAAPAPAPAKKKEVKKTETKTTTAKTVKTTDWRVQLGAFRSEAEAKAEWKRLQGKFKTDLGKLSMLTEKADIAGKGVMFRLQAGPVKNKEAGRTLCKKLTQSGQGCFVVQ